MKRATLLTDTRKADKKKRTEATNGGGLLKFGFTGVHVGSVPPNDEYTKCPQCDCLIRLLDICEHMNSCQSRCCYREAPSPSSDQTKANAFDIMRKSAALKPASISSATSMYFALVLKDEKLMPVFSTSGDYIDQLYTQCESPIRQTIKWTCEANVKKFRWHFNSNEPSHRAIVLHLSTNIPTDTNVSYADTAPISTGWLKSMIQKAVRRRLNTKAVKLANMMCKANNIADQSGTKASCTGSSGSNSGSSSKPIKTDQHSAPSSANSNTSLLSELLRRLPIICLEDTALHPAYPILIWLMVAVSKGYVPSRFLIDIVLLITNDIANCTYKDSVPPAEYDMCSVTANFSENSANNNALSPNSANTGKNIADLHSYAGIENDSVRTLIACICIRASFGGMAGDMEMLDQYAQLWYTRLMCGDNSVSTYSSSKASNGLKREDNPPFLISVPDEKLGKDEECTECATISYYLHPSYTSELCTHNNDRSRLWARQMYDNFPVYDCTTLAPAFAMTNSHNVTQNSSNDICSSSIATAAERQLLHILLNTNNTTLTSTAISKPTNYTSTPKLSTLLKVTAQDLVPEGLDHHCDWGLVPYILSACNERVQLLTQQLDAVAATSISAASSDLACVNSSILSQLSILRDVQLETNVKSAIWLFRSANNSRKLYPLIAQNVHSEVDNAVFTHYQKLVESDLAQKRSLARLWGIVCPMLVAYCERKMTALSHRL